VFQQALEAAVVRLDLPPDASGQPVTGPPMSAQEAAQILGASAT